MTATFQLYFVLGSIGVVTFISWKFRMKNQVATTRDGALEALKHVQEWAKWMAGIQTAGFGALALLTFDKEHAIIRSLESAPRLFAVIGFVYLACALLCTAWVLSSLPSLALRLYGKVSTGEKEESFDVYELPFYGWLAPLKLGFMLTLMHSLWAIVLLGIGAYCVWLLVYP